MTESEIIQLRKEYERNTHSVEVSFKKILKQISIFEKSIPYIKVVRPCKIGDGIREIEKEGEYDELVNIFRQELDEGRVSRFVPASGAASRMFKRLQSVSKKFIDVNRSVLEKGAASNDSDCSSVLEFFKNIKKFAFYDELKETMTEDKTNLETLLQENKYGEIINYVLDSKGLNYLNQPKGCVLFHKYPDESRTAFEEHLLETHGYAKGDNSPAKIHFTISVESGGLVSSIISHALGRKSLGNEIKVSYSFQKKSTDTIAVTLQNKPVTDNRGDLVFRPAGHGALIENLNDMKGDIVFIKNIDNIAAEHVRKPTYMYKELLGGYLLRLQSKLFTYLRALELEDISAYTINSIKKFAESELLIRFNDDFNSLNTSLAIKVLVEKLNRPIRVCGMVKNEGEPGGGPFWVEEEDGSTSLQIVEKSQIDLNNPDQLEVLKSSTHFNPVDLVCGVRDYNGNPFDLLQFTNPDSGLITTKSLDGNEIKALELPGLWNGGMAKWITIFVKVPLITFNPVKEVNDLLKKEHQPPISS